LNRYGFYDEIATARGCKVYWNNEVEKARRLIERRSVMAMVRGLGVRVSMRFAQKVRRVGSAEDVRLVKPHVNMEAVVVVIVEKDGISR